MEAFKRKEKTQKERGVGMNQQLICHNCSGVGVVKATLKGNPVNIDCPACDGRGYTTYAVYSNKGELG